MTILNGQSILSSAMSGLSYTYSTLMTNAKSKQGISLEDLSNLTSQQLATLGNNYSFVQYLTNNFKSLDKDGDGLINNKDMEQLMNTMQTKGLTYNEIQSLCTSGGGNSTLLSTVLTYFNKIDANGDGRITSEELTRFSYDCQKYDVEAKYKSYKATSTSLFYNDGVKDDLTSVLDSVRPKLETNSKS